MPHSSAAGVRRGLPGQRVRLLAVVLAVVACHPLPHVAPPIPPSVSNPSSCLHLQLRTSRTGDALGAPAIAWSGAPGGEHDLWCRGVGPAVSHHPAHDDGPIRLADLGVVTWNVQGGGGDVDALLADLRSGRLDGEPTQAFVLFLQEAIRTGSDVPVRPGSLAKVGKRVAPAASRPIAVREHRSIDAVARRHGLHLLYVPSMRNGGRADPPEDRGNAILSSVPLLDLEAMELPLEKQRRVTVSARIAAATEHGETVDVQLVNLHLDLRSAWRRVHRSLGLGRAAQARVTVERYAREPVVVAGGDLNTWFRGRSEDAVRILDEAFPHTASAAGERTVSTPGFLPDLRLDHLFFRLPGSLRASYRVGANRYGSDHYPVVARIGPRAHVGERAGRTGAPTRRQSRGDT